MVQPSKLSTPTEVLAGLVDRVTFHKSENGFCVLRVKARGQRDLLTLVGHAAMISVGEFVQASGSWINDRTQGVQFKASFLKATAPTAVEGIEKYLGSGMIRGIGPVYAKKLVRAFGEAVFDVIQQEPDRLREVTGIGPGSGSKAPLATPPRFFTSRTTSGLGVMVHLRPPILPLRLDGLSAVRRLSGLRMRRKRRLSVFPLDLEHWWKQAGCGAV
jgi:hypothetical protein